MREWNYNVGKMPVGKAVLVLLAEPMLGMRVHGARKSKISNGTLTFVGSYSESDAPAIIAWVEVPFAIPTMDFVCTEGHEYNERTEKPERYCNGPSTKPWEDECGARVKLKP